MRGRSAFGAAHTNHLVMSTRPSGIAGRNFIFFLVVVSIVGSLSLEAIRAFGLLHRGGGRRHQRQFSDEENDLTPLFINLHGQGILGNIDGAAS
jgi:hypothetical protein